MTKGIVLALTFAALCAAPAYAAAPSAADAKAVVAAINATNDAMNKGDMKAVSAAYGANVSIIDEVAPYHWSGAHAFDDWVAAFMADGKVNAISAPLMKLYKPSTLSVAGDRAYLVIPALFTFKAHGKKMREAGSFAYVMQRDGAAWKIDAWAWAKK